MIIKNEITRDRTIKLFKEIAQILKPRPPITISEWADNYRKLSKESSAEPGRWNTDRAPYQREIMNAIGDDETEEVTIMSSAQVGKSEIINNTSAYYMDYDPCPIMILQPTIEMAESYSKDRIAPMIRDTPVLKAKVSEVKSKDSSNTIRQKKFPGGQIVLTGTNSAASLASRPIRVVLADEVDRFEKNVGGEGDPLALAKKRTETFWNRKVVKTSTPTIKGASRIEKEYEKGSMERWNLSCPSCGEYQPLEWVRIIFDGITMECKYCGKKHTEQEWKKQKGKWIAEKENKKHRSFHLNALASPWRSWEEIIAEWKKVHKDRESLKTFINTYLGESWEEGEKVDETKLLERREYYNCEVPEDVLVLTAGVDTQDNRLEVEVVGWGVGRESWGIEYKIFMGKPSEEHVWRQLEDYLDKTFIYASGIGITISCAAIDSGGHHTDDVYSFVKRNEYKRWFAVKGKGGDGIPLVGKPSKSNKAAVNLFSLGVDGGKANIYARLSIENPGPKYCHYPIEEEKGYNEEYFLSLTSEKRVIEDSGKTKWVKIRKNNEALDCRNYAMAAHDILNPQLELLAQRPRGDYYNTRRVRIKKKRKVSRGVI
mgnify:FL=1